MGLEDNIVTYLEGQATITAIIGNSDSPETIRLYPILMPQGTTLPAAIYQRIAGPRGHHLTGADGRAVPSIQFDLYSTSYSTVKGLADALRGVLDGYYGAMGGITVDRVTLENEIDGWDDETDYFRIMQDYTFSYVE